MVWDWLRRKLGGAHDPGEKGGGDARPAGPVQERRGDLPEVSWMAPEQSPWGIAVLDVSPVTHHMLSTTRDPRCAQNLASLGGDDGTSFIGVSPDIDREVHAGLVYPTDGLFDGVLFSPKEMEDKWALYVHRGKLIVVRSWQRAVLLVADVSVDGDMATVGAVRGAATDADEPPEFTVRLVDFLLRTHALGEPFPAPLPRLVAADTRQAALWCMSMYGRQASVASVEPPPASLPTSELRTQSLLHIAAARGSVESAIAALEAGIPPTAISQAGDMPLHWAASTGASAVVDLLLDRGAPVDARDREGATSLMIATQKRSAPIVQRLLTAGADPDAVDQRGFTALHRAAEMGERAIVEALLSRGARRDPVANGHTPRSLAEGRGHRDIASLL